MCCDEDVASYEKWEIQVKKIDSWRAKFMPSRNIHGTTLNQSYNMHLAQKFFQKQFCFFKSFWKSKSSFKSIHKDVVIMKQISKWQVCKSYKTLLQQSNKNNSYINNFTFDTVSTPDTVPKAVLEFPCLETCCAYGYELDVNTTVGCLYCNPTFIYFFIQ